MKWHSVLRKMPEPYQLVLVYSPTLTEPVRTGRLSVNGEHWTFYSGVKIEAIVTHWMELPQPPEAKR